MTPLKGLGWMREANVSNGLSEAKEKSQPLVSGVAQMVLLLPGYSTQKSFRPVPAKMFRRFPLPPCGRAKVGSSPGPNDSRSTTSGAGGVVGRGLTAVPPPPPPAPPPPPLHHRPRRPRDQRLGGRSLPRPRKQRGSAGSFIRLQSEVSP